MNESEFEYAGFWVRAIATLIDTLLSCSSHFRVAAFKFGPLFLSRSQSGCQ